MRKKLVIAIVGVFCLATSIFGQRRPEWVTSRPTDPNFYIGIGMAQKGDEYDYVQRARSAALSDLSAEITVNISSELVSVAVEQSGLSEEQVRQEIRASTQSELEGYELADTWENREEYWTYYRLSKAVYVANKQEKLDNAISLATDLFENGKRLEQQNLTDAIRSYVQAYKPIVKYVAEPLQTTFQGQTIYLKNELYTALQSAFSNLELIPVRAKIEAKMGLALQDPLVVKAFYQPSAGESYPVPGLPVHFQFLRGEGDLLEDVTTNSDGVATCQVSKISASDKLQMIQARVDLNRLIELDSTTATIRGIIEGFSVPDTRIILDVKGLMVYMAGNELNFGSAMDVPYVEPLLKSALADKGFSFSEDMGSADFFIEYEARSRKGSVVYGQHVAYVDVNISIIDMRTGDEVYQQAFQNVKGIHLDFDRAGLKAFENAGKEAAKEFIPAMMSRVEG